MSAPNKSFFSGLHLLVTGLAALVTASVAIFGVAVNQGWLKGNAARPSGSGGLAAGTGGTGPDTTAPTTAPVPQYAVDPPSVAFQVLAGGPATMPVKVTNTGVVPMTVDAPTLTGAEASHFTVSDQTCASSVDPGRSCLLQLTFTPTPGTFSATLVVEVEGAVRATEVPVTATVIL